MRISLFSFLISITCIALITIVVLDILNIQNLWELPKSLEVLNLPSIILVICGVLLSTTLTYPSSDLRKSLPYLFLLFFQSKISEKELNLDANRILGWQQLLNHNRKKNRNDLGDSLHNTFEGYVFSLLSTSYSEDQVRELAKAKIAYRYNQMQRSARIYSSMGVYAPSFGMLGTLIGLIFMLSSFDSIEALGAGLSFALMTTFYGILLANVLFYPIEGKIRSMAENEYLRSMLILEGILLIEQGKPAIFVNDALKTYSNKLTVEDFPNLDKDPHQSELLTSKKANQDAA